MKRFVFVLTWALAAGFLQAQEPVSAVRGVTYGAGATKDGELVQVSRLEQKMGGEKFSGKITGKVLEVCQEKGCWMKLERPDGQPVMVRFKDYKFFMPKDIVSREVVLDGEAMYKEVSVDMLRHYARDAGKPEEEVLRIREPRREVQFVAKGVLVL